MAELTVNVDVTAINAAITAEAAARVAGDAASVAAAASDATTKASNAQSAAISAAATDATTKANAAQAASDPVGSASAAQAAAIAAAASDATTKANAAQAAAQAASQPADSDLTAIAALSTTAYGRSLLTLADAAAGRTNFGLWTTVMKTATTTRNSTATLAVDPVLKLAMPANTKYELDIIIHMDTVAAADFKFRLSGPASPSLVRAWIIYYAGPASGGTTSPASAVRIENTYSAADITILSAAAQLGGFISARMTIHNAANAGDFEFQWAQNTSDSGDTSVLAGSYLKWRAMP